MYKLKVITDNSSEWSLDKAFETLHEIVNDTLDENLPILDSARIGAQKTTNR